MLFTVNLISKYKYLILILSLSLSAKASCPKDQGHQKTCPIQKLEVSEEKNLPTVLVFASFSMPEPALKQLAIDLKKINGALVIRGLINNSFKDTSIYIQKVGEGVLLDPTLFDKFNITAVPTFIITEGNLKAEQTPLHDRLTGNVSLRFVLEQSLKEGEIKNIPLLLEKLQERV